MTWRIGIPDTTLGTIVAAILWLARELVWWWVATILAGVIMCFVLDSAVGVWLVSRIASVLGRRRRFSST
jgi:hypothetical protein